MISSFVLLEVDGVMAIHARVLLPNELPGMAKDKSLSAVLEKVHNRLIYGFIHDVFDLVACYGAFIAKGHCFIDANKRTAAAAVFIGLRLNGISLTFKDTALGQWIIDLVNDQQTEIEFSHWLRQLHNQNEFIRLT